MKRVNLDHNSTTPMRAEAREAWLEVIDSSSGNPSSLHASGREARHRIDEARERVAAALRVREDEVLFTSGGTESNNLALFGVAGTGAPRTSTAALVTTEVEHSSILSAASALEGIGHRVERIGVDDRCRPSRHELVERARAGPAKLVSIQAANNEVGAVPDLEGLGEELETGTRGGRPLLHVDAVQALGRIPIHLDRWGADLASFSAHKVGGPSGVGVLYRRSGARVRPMVLGGEQEHGLRAGTENVAGIVASSIAIDLAVAEQEAHRRDAMDLSHFLWRELRGRLPSARLIGPDLDAPDRLPNTLCVLFSGIDGKVLVTRLDLEGLEVSAGSACASGSLEPSHVLVAMGLAEDEARAGLRLSSGRATTRDDCRRAVDILVKVFDPSHAT